MDTSDEKNSDERDQTSKNHEEKMTEDIEVLKMRKLSSQKNIVDIENYSDESNWMDMSDEKDYDERDHSIKKDKEKVSYVIEVLKLGKLILQKI